MSHTSLAKIDTMKREREILVNRFVIGIVACALVFFLADDRFVLMSFAYYLGFNTVLYWMHYHNFGKQELRWLAAIFLDVSMSFTVNLHSPEIMSLTYPAFLWVILGNGFRFGIRYLAISAAAFAITFGIVVQTTPFWTDKLSLGYSLTAALLIIPAYCSSLIRKLSRAKEQAEAASKAKSYFLASVSHELRTPLNAIIGFGNHMRSMEMPKSQRDMIDASVLAGEHLLHLIEQLLQVARTDNGAPQAELKTMRPTDILSEVRNIMVGRADDKGIDLHLYATPLSDRMINAPTDIIRNILLNLVGNAIKFTESGAVVVSGEIRKDAGNATLILSVADSGIGIATDAQDRIFQPFQQADDSVLDRFGGTGLGLAICRQLCEQVGGNISVESEIGQGSCFTVAIPVVVVESQTETDELHSAPEVKLLALGNFNADLLAKAQAAGNYAVRNVPISTADEIPHALNQMDLDGFDVAIIDQKLASAIADRTEIWSIFANAAIAPVLVTNDDPIDLEDITLRAAFASVIPPSPDFDILRSAIRIGCSFSRNPSYAKTVEAPVVVPTQRPNSILVADDNRTNRHILTAILESAGHEVTTVCDGDEAVEALENGTFDVLLLDVNMPRMNGIDACRIWRQIEGGRQRLPIIGVTADATAETEARCLSAGMDLRLTKPVNSKLLLDTIASFNDAQSQKSDLPDRVADPLQVVVPITGIVPPADDQTIDGAQVAYLRSIGDEDFLASMIDGFQIDITEAMDTMRAAVTSNDPGEFRFAAHAIKSCSNNIGAVVLGALCGRLEGVTEPEFKAGGAGYLTRVETEIDKAIAALNTITSVAKPDDRLSA